MTEKEKTLCAPKKDLSSLISLGEEFARRMKKQAQDFKTLGKDTTVIDKNLADLTKQISAHKRALKL